MSPAVTAFSTFSADLSPGDGSVYNTCNNHKYLQTWIVANTLSLSYHTPYTTEGMTHVYHTVHMLSLLTLACTGTVAQ
jgi:hypothetical protein